MKKLLKPVVQNYLRMLTKVVLWRHRPLIIAVAGTANKTFVKEMILDELGRGPGIRGNPKSFNTEIGLPLAVLFLPSGYSSIFKWVDVLLTGTMITFFSKNFPKILVLELGVDRKGDMDYLLSMVKPRIAVVTRIERSFPDNNTSMDDVAEEIGKLVGSVPSQGAVLLNADDQRVADLAKLAQAKVILYGNSDKADAVIRNIRNHDHGQSFELVMDGQTLKGQTSRFGQHNINSSVISKIIAFQIARLDK